MRICEARFLKAIEAAAQAPRPERPAVAFAGRSNVGKSSLINALAGRKGLARTSSTPGRTQQIIYFEIERKFHFIDLPGYGYAQAPESIRRRWGSMIEGFLKVCPSLKLVVVILDARHGPSELDLQMVRWLESLGRSYVFVATKCDKLKRGALQSRLREMEEELGAQRSAGVIPFSVKTGRGRLELLRVIGQALEA